MRTGSRTLLIAFALLATLAAPAKALEIFGNTGLGNAGRQLGPAGYEELAQGFTIGSTPYQLSSVDIGLRFTGTVPTSSQIFVSLYTNNGSNNPGTLIGSFNTASPSPTFAPNTNDVYRFNYTGSTTLVANTSYWVVVRTSLSPVYDWYYAQGGPTDTPTVKNSSGVSYFGTRTMEAFSSTWTNANANYSGLRYTVNVVPEPSTYALGLAGTLVLGTIARRRNRLAVTA